jgi:hypothetical protein
MPETNKKRILKLNSSFEMKDRLTAVYVILYIILLLFSILIVTHIGRLIYFYIFAGVTLSVMTIVGVYEC